MAGLVTDRLWILFGCLRIIPCSIINNRNKLLGRAETIDVNFASLIMLGMYMYQMSRVMGKSLFWVSDKIRSATEKRPGA